LPLLNEKTTSSRRGNENTKENTKMMPRYCLSLDNLMYFVEKFNIVDQKYIADWVLRLDHKKNITPFTRRFEDMNFIFSW
jgi:hypothetical protein